MEDYNKIAHSNEVNELQSHTIFIKLKRRVN